ncbi:hypothetical protein D1641_00850 [Colidextribacter sp. OB.20]|uniref:hypothetical protein n=1 Tax=Colidextribacter sp. OB.20 TaxID=2304568 RepID=UPI00136E4DA9|nr:hypothetical protein [Colidextribacter sp. OB.20]NBI08569.1 hypothetical protein [Colidextribacter sp. OB.20]
MYANPYAGNAGIYQPDPNAMTVRQQPSQPAQPQGNTGEQTVFPCVPVMSRAEAERAEFNCFGPGLIMTNLGQGMIYLKRFNPQKGEVEILDFAFVPPPPPTAPIPAAYNPRDDIAAMRENMAALQASVAALCGEIEESKKAGQKKIGGKAAEA